MILIYDFDKLSKEMNDIISGTITYISLDTVKNSIIVKYGHVEMISYSDTTNKLYLQELSDKGIFPTKVILCD